MRFLFRPWSHLLDFEGRASRREYALFHLGFVLLFLIVGVVGVVVTVLVYTALGWSRDASDRMIFALGLVWRLLALLLLVVGHVSVSIRRLHDQGVPWPKFLLTLIPVVGLVFWAMLVFPRGDIGANAYGDDPRIPASASTEMLGSVFS